ncbi:protein tramtrack, alpha isoform-like, partial [Phymastichus coffea]|uniref:protein tramtrack, alpha isoform-like n=1 Tax=Phymastichus coffea TaxID=108790 RepID=UPI00273C0F3B
KLNERKIVNFADFASSASSSSSVKSDASDKSRGPSSTPDNVAGQHSIDSPTRGNAQSAPSTPSTTSLSSSSTTSTTTTSSTTASPRSSSAQRANAQQQQHGSTTQNANSASSQPAGAMSAPSGRQVPKRRMRRRATSQSQDPAEQLTEMSVRGLNLFRYASISEGVYQCTECAKVDIQKTFKNKYSFQRHAFLYHEGHQRKVFPCPVCGKEFSRPDKMKNHMKTVHDCFMPKDCVMPFSFFQLQ